MNGGTTQELSPEWMPASSMCSMMPPITTAPVASAIASTSNSKASSRNLSTSTGCSGDASTALVPPFICPERHLATIRDYTRRIARALKVVGLMNVQYAIKDDVVYVLEVNPRASRTVPYLSKATGVSLAKIAAKVMAGRTLAELGLTDDIEVAGRVREEPGVPVRPIPRRRHDSRTGDEVDRRGDGRLDELRRRVRARRSSRSGSGCRSAAPRSSA